MPKALERMTDTLRRAHRAGILRCSKAPGGGLLIEKGERKARFNLESGRWQAGQRESQGWYALAAWLEIDLAIAAQLANGAADPLAPLERAGPPPREPRIPMAKGYDPGAYAFPDLGPGEGRGSLE